jgi:CheY-like chemotaxis protein
VSFRVLIVEDEVTLLSALLRGLAGLPGVEIEGCSSGEQALESLSRAVPDLAILDINLPGISGLDLIEDLSDHAPPVPVVVTTAYANVHRQRLATHRGLEILEKPVPLEDLRRLIARRASHLEASWSSGAFQVADYLQLASLGRHSVTLLVTGESCGEGRIEVFEGEVWSARCGALAGEEALEFLITHQAQRIHCTPLAEPAAERQIVVRSEQVLLEIARRQDESRHAQLAARGGGAGEPASALLAVDAGDGRDGHEGLFAEAMSAYLERRYERALELLESFRRLRPDDPRAVHNIERIKSRRGLK